VKNRERDHQKKKKKVHSASQGGSKKKDGPGGQGRRKLHKFWGKKRRRGRDREDQVRAKRVGSEPRAVDALEWGGEEKKDNGKTGEGKGRERGNNGPVHGGGTGLGQEGRTKNGSAKNSGSKTLKKQVRESCRKTQSEKATGAKGSK